MRITLTQKLIDESIQFLRKATEKREAAQLSLSMSGALDVTLEIANIAYEGIKSIGTERLDKIGKIIGEPTINKSLIEKIVIPKYHPDLKLADHYDGTQHALSCLNAYKILIPWQQKLDDFRKLNQLDGLL